MTRNGREWLVSTGCCRTRIGRSRFQSLNLDQYSDVIASDVGYHILLVVERDSQHLLSPDAYLVMQEKALQDWLAQKRTESDIVAGPLIETLHGDLDERIQFR